MLPRMLARASRPARPSSRLTGRVNLSGSRRRPGLQAGADKLCSPMASRRARAQLRSAAQHCSRVLVPPSDTNAGRLPDRTIRHPRAVAVAPARRAVPTAHDCFFGDDVFILWLLHRASLPMLNKDSCQLSMPALLKGRAVRVPPRSGAALFIISVPYLVIAAVQGGGLADRFRRCNARRTDLLDEWLARIKQELAAHDAPIPIPRRRRSPSSDRA